MVEKYIIETKDDVIYGLLDFSERKNGSKSPKKKTTTSSRRSGLALNPKTSIITKMLFTIIL